MLFELAKQFIETQINAYKQFLLEHIGPHDIPLADITVLEEWVAELKVKLNRDLGKTFEGVVKTVVVPNWKTIFEADNFIDTDKTIEEQKIILASILDSLHKTGFVDDKYLPSHIVEIINRDFLKDSEYKVKVLIEELTAEYNLCNPDIDWVDALIERIRVMYYSGLLVGDMDGIETVIEKFNPEKFDSIKDMVNIDEFNAYKSLLCNGNVKESHPMEQLVTKTDIELAIQMLKEKQLLPRKVSVLDAASSIAFICIGVAPSDDWMDLDEDLENHKITGITRAIDQGISPKDILQTTLLFLKKGVEEKGVFRNIELWYIELMTLMVQDLPKCLEFCKSVSPYMFESIFQRK